MVDQPEGRPKSPGPGKVKPVTKKHSVSKPYERPSSSRGVLARVKELITPVTPGWLKDLVLRPPQTTSVTDALEQTVAEVQAADEKGPEEFKKTLKSLSLPITEVKPEPKLPFTTERIPAKPKTSTILDVSEVNTSQTNLNKSNVLEETLGEIKWSAIRPAVKEKYSFSVAAFNTPSKSPNLSSISIHNKSLARPNSSPFTNRSRVSFGGNSLQRTLLHNRTANNPAVKDDKKPIKVKPISRTSIRPGVTSNTAKKILEQLESLSRPLGHLPSSRPSTPSSRPCSRASTPLSLSRPSTPQHLQPYKSERSVPIRSLTSTPLERQDKPDINTSTISTTAASVGGKIKREKTNHYSRAKEEEDEELIVPDFETVPVPQLEFKPIVIENNTDHKPIKIVNQTPSHQKDHVSLKDAIKSTLTSNISPLMKKKSPSPDQESSSDSSFSFSAPISVTNAVVSSTSLTDSAEFSFGAPGSASGIKSKAKSVEDMLRSDREEGKGEEEEEEKVEIAAQQPPGSWSCAPCKLSNPSAMTRCSGCEAPNPSLQLPGLFAHSPIGIKRAPITPMKPACSPKQTKLNPLSFGLGKMKEESDKASPLVKFSFAQQGWSCATCLVQNRERDETCAACQATKPSAVISEKKQVNKLAGMDNPLLKFKKTPSNWSCSSCMLSNPADLNKCQACQTDKPASENKKPALNPLLAFSQNSGWTCDTCMLQNESSAVKCSACETPKPGPVKPAEKPPSSIGVFQKLGKFKQSGWSCDMCMLTNSDSDVKCKACQTLKPGAKAEEIKEEKKEVPKSSFTFGLSSTTGPSDSKPGFGDIKLSSTFSFGAKSDSTDNKGDFTFGVQKKDKEKTDEPAESKPAFSFGAATTSADNKGGFSFGQAPTEKKTEEAKPAFNFGSAPKTENKPAETKPAFNFGGPAKEEVKPAFGSLTSDTAPKFNFGGSKTEDKTETSAAPAFNFGGTATAATTSGTTKPFNFGGNATTTGNTETKPAAGFGFGGSAPSSTTPTTGLNFGGTTTTTTTTTQPAFNFGAPKPTTTTAAPTFNFGGTAAPKSDTPAFQFGAAPGPSTDSGDTMDASSQSPKGFSFGQKPAASNGPTFSFGSSNNNQSTTGFSFGPSTTNTPGPAFGSTTSAPAFGTGSTPAPSFGAGSTPAPSFGSNNTTTATPAFNFGQSNSSFGQPSTNTPSFNFGGSSQPASTGFKFPAPTPPQPASTGFKFGGSATSTPAPSFNFGGTASSTPDSKPFAFGSSGNTNTPTPAPSFGATNPPAPSFGNTPAIPAPTFNFGAGTATPPNAAFQFGSPQSTPTQNNNMFNPVSSSTTGRRIKKAVRRTKR